MSYIGTRIHERRMTCAMDMDALCAAAGISKAYLSELESGKKTNPGKKVLERICAALFISADDLIAEDGFIHSGIPVTVWHRIRDTDPNDMNAVELRLALRMARDDIRSLEGILASHTTTLQEVTA